MFDLSTGIPDLISGIIPGRYFSSLFRYSPHPLVLQQKIKHFKNSVVKIIRIVSTFVTGNHDFLCVKSFT